MQNKSSGLGRGLGSLIPNKKLKDLPALEGEVASFLTVKEKVWEIPTNKVVPNPHQPRADFKQEELEDLANSIKEYGIIQPLIVTQIGQDSWQLIAGERRLRAAKSLGLNVVPAVIRDLTEQKKMEIALIENLQRQNLNPLEIAIAYQKLIDEFNLTHEELSKKIGKSRSVIANFLRLLNLRVEVKQAIIDGRITEGHARVMAGLPEEDQLIVLDKILKNNFNVRETERAGKEIVVKKHIRKVSFKPEIKAKEDELKTVLGTKVEIKEHGGAGQIIIRFFSLDELEEIFKKIT